MSNPQANSTKKNMVSNYKIEKTIGEGTFGKVKLAKHLPTGEYVAIKILEKSKIHDSDEFTHIEKEIKYLKLLKHANIIKIYEIKENTNNFYIVMEYVNGGELFNYIVKNDVLSEAEASFFFTQIIYGVEEIHRLSISHRDLKPENILLSNSKTLKIIDFGLSNKCTDYWRTPCGSPCYASPEMVRGGKYNGFAVDIWSCGIILFAMVCGYWPFDEKNNDALFAKIIECKIEFPPEHDVKLSHEVKDLIMKIWTPNPIKRIGIDDIKKHPFWSSGKAQYAKKAFPTSITKEEESIVVNYMINVLNFKNDNNEIVTLMRNDRHNNITTTFKLVHKKLSEGRLTQSNINKNIQLATSGNTPLDVFNKYIATKTESNTAHSSHGNHLNSKHVKYSTSINSINREWNEDIENSKNNSKINQNILNVLNFFPPMSAKPNPGRTKEIYNALLTNRVKGDGTTIEIKGLNTRKFDTSVSVDKPQKKKEVSVDKKKNEDDTQRSTKGKVTNWYIQTKIENKGQHRVRGALIKYEWSDSLNQRAVSDPAKARNIKYTNNNNNIKKDHNNNNNNEWISHMEKHANYPKDKRVNIGNKAYYKDKLSSDHAVATCKPVINKYDDIKDYTPPHKRITTGIKPTAPTAPTAPNAPNVLNKYIFHPSTKHQNSKNTTPIKTTPVSKPRHQLNTLNINIRNINHNKDSLYKAELSPYSKQWNHSNNINESIKEHPSTKNRKTYFLNTEPNKGSDSTASSEYKPHHEILNSTLFKRDGNGNNLMNMFNPDPKQQIYRKQPRQNLKNFNKEIINTHKNKALHPGSRQYIISIDTKWPSEEMVNKLTLWFAKHSLVSSREESDPNRFIVSMKDEERNKFTIEMEDTVLKMDYYQGCEISCKEVIKKLANELI